MVFPDRSTCVLQGSVVLETCISGIYLGVIIRVDASNQVKLVVLASVITVLVVGISIGGPKFINALQLHFGSKGKIELIDRCIKMPGCSIGPDELDFYERYHTVRDSDAAQKIKESDAVEELLEE